ncbi:hypothetical protein M405DRAFT_865959 [Rhizopogon salebrosus TDB-379]|nr:hypothetical protein M405DRAFT_865959 [Rhizopogon salebrosus TDB-379]
MQGSPHARNSWFLTVVFATILLSGVAPASGMSPQTRRSFLTCDMHRHGMLLNESLAS